MNKAGKRGNEIAVFFMLFISLAVSILMRPFGSLDELWIYNMGLNISRGMMPYSEVGIITMPLSQLISAFLIKLFGEHLMVLRAASVILSVTDCIILYHIMLKLKINNDFSLIIVCFISMLYSSMFTYDYNYVILTLALAAVYVQLCAYESNKLRYAVISSLLGCAAFYCKQSVGLFLWIMLFVNNIYLYKNKKSRIIITVFNVLTALLTSSAMIFILLVNNAFDDFINYCFKGISEFTNCIPIYKYMFNSIDGFLICSYSIIFVISGIVRAVKCKSVQLILLLNILAALATVAYPISDSQHTYIPFMIVILVSLVILKDKIDKINMKGSVYCLYIIIGIGVVLAFALTYKPDLKLSEIAHYEKIPISKNMEKQINMISGYIDDAEGKTAILDAAAAVYFIPIDKYNKNMDMFLNGNLGGKAEDVLNKEIDMYDRILVLKEGYGRNWQFPSECEYVVKENGEKTDEILCYDVYCIKHERK